MIQTRSDHAACQALLQTARPVAAVAELGPLGIESMSISIFMSQHGGYIVAIALIGALVACWLYSRRLPPYLSRWAKGRKVQIMRFRRPVLSGPFSGFFTAAYDHLHEREVYFLRVRELDGCERKCWVLCSSDFMSGVEVVEVKWV